jgi:hypothetical protein
VQAPRFTRLRTYKVVLLDGQVMVDLDKAAGDQGSFQLDCTSPSTSWPGMAVRRTASP